jgi:uncharacterized cupin superfamily protein
MHRHSHAEEFVYIVQGRPMLRTDRGSIELTPGMCAGLPPNGVAQQLTPAK